MNRMTDLTSDSGMTRIQLLILAILVIVIIGLSLPPFLKDRKVSQADVDVETIAKAIKKYYKHTGEYPAKLQDLVKNPSIEGWKSPYLDKVPKTPWNGDYQLIQNSYKIRIAEDNRVPQKYRLGKIAEISRVYAESPESQKYWW